MRERGNCVMFCLIPNIETMKKRKFRVFGPSKDVFFSIYLFSLKNFFLLKLKPSIIET